MAQQLNEPVAICSTSGSAALNYSPAIAEAYYQKIPLIGKDLNKYSKETVQQFIEDAKSL